jgi:hypothetical protein
MFDEVYRIAIESNNFEELKRKLKKPHMDALAIKDGVLVTAGAQLAREGRNDKVEWMRQLGASVDDIALGYARAGNHERVEAYRTEHGASVGDIALGYALAGNHEKEKKYDINCLLDSYLKERTAVVDSSGRTKEYFHGSFFAVFQKSFTQKRDAVTALKSALSGDNVDLSEHLSTLRNGSLGKELRAFVKSGMANALAGKEVTTVSDFVRALQDKNSNQQQLS